MTLNRRDDDKQVVTVILGNAEPTYIKKQFRCSACGKIVFEYYTENKIILIIGEMREVSRPIDIFCNHCKTCYRVA